MRALIVAACLLVGCRAMLPAGAAERLALPAPKLVAPGDGWNVCQLAADFRWANLEAPKEFVEYRGEEAKKPFDRRAALYQLQAARDRGFTQLLLDRKLPAVDWKQDAGQRYIPEEMLPVGQCFWRVRALGPGEAPGAWSETRRLVVVRKEGMAPLVREISPRKPLLLVLHRIQSPVLSPGEVTFTDKDGTQRQPALTTDLIPADLRPYVGMSFWGHGPNTRVDEIAPQYEAAHAAGLAIFLRGTMSLSEIEWAYQHYPQTVIGVEMDEMGDWWTYYPALYRRFLERAVRLSAAYGRYYLQAEGNYRALPFADLLENPGWMSFLRTYGKYTIWGVKTNISPVIHATQGLYRGLWLDGLTAGYCMWGEGFYWDHAGFRRLGECGTYRQYWKEGAAGYYPGIMWPQTFAVGAAQGASVYVVSGWQLLWDKGLAPPQPIWMHYTLPLFKALVEKQLIVTREEALAATKLAVEARSVPKTTTPSLYGAYDPLFRSTYGLTFPGSDYSDLIPDNGRYYFIPLVSPLAKRASDAIRTLTLDRLSTAEAVRGVFDAAYPPFSKGDAWICRVNDKFTIENSSENRDIAQSFDLPLAKEGVRRIRGPIPLHTYIVGKMSDGGRTLWLQADTHHRTESRARGRFVVEAPIRDTEITLECSRPPRITVIPAGALLSREAGDAGRQVRLRLSHTGGAVEVTVQCP